MPTPLDAKRNSQRYKRVSQVLRAHDARKKISETAIALAKARGHITDDIIANAGRRLHYYSGVVDQISRRLGRFEGKRFLHIASSTGVLTRYIQDRKGIATSLDFDQEFCEIAKKIGNKLVVQADASPQTTAKHILPFEANSFHCLIADHFVFAKYKLLDLKKEHEGSQAILKDAVRVLAPNGIFVLSAVDLNLNPNELIEISKRYFQHVEPFAYVEEKHLIPGFVLSGPRKEIL